MKLILYGEIGDLYNLLPFWTWTVVSLYTRILEEYSLQHKINPEWELHTTLKNAGLLICLVWTDSLWHLLKFAVIQPQGLGLKHLKLHLHVCPSVTVKTSFVFNLAHCVAGGYYLYTWNHPFFQACWKTDRSASFRNFRRMVATASVSF